MTGIFIKALMKGASKVSPTIKSVKPKVGSLKTRRAGQDEVIKSADKAIQKNKLTKEQGVSVKKAIAPGLKKVSKTQDKIDKLRENKMGGGMMGRRMGMKKGSGKKFPDLTGDGKVTFADILKGRGVINGKKKKNGSIYLSKKK